MGEYGQDSAMGPRVGVEPELGEDSTGMGFDGAVADAELRGYPVVRVARRHKGEDVALLAGQLGDGVIVAWRFEDDGPPLGIDRRPACGNATSRVDELLRAGDALLQQVPDTRA